MKFEVLSLEERISRLEALVQDTRDVLTKDIFIQAININDEIGTLLGKRECDGAPLVKKEGNEVGLFDDELSILKGTLVISQYDSVGNKRWSLGIDKTGQFFVYRVDIGLIFVADDDGLLIRDQNGNLGKVEVEASTGYLKFIPI